MPFGSSNAGSAVFEDAIDLTMVHLPPEFWLIYLDDILVYSTDPWEHLEHLRKVVQAHTKAEIRIQPKKTKIFRSEVEYLGHKVEQRLSSNAGRLHQGTYRNGHAQLAARRCLHSAEDMEKDFRELKEEFMAGKIQAYPDFDSHEPFILTMDWSPVNIAGILSQKQVGVECFIRCWSRKCSRYEKHYPSMKGELLALVKSIERWKHILKYQ